MISFYAILILVGWTPSPPPKPAPIPITDNECPEEIGLDVGEPIPYSVFDAELEEMRCGAVLVPVSVALDLVAMENWGKSTEIWYKIYTAQIENERDWYKKQAEYQAPFWERPGFWVMMGGIGGIGISMAAVLWIEEAKR